MSEAQPGEVIAGKFQIERVIGEGGMGYVVAARHLQLGQMVALKFMRDEVCSDEYKARFLREARNTVRLKSKHVSRVLDVGTMDGGAPYMVMEYLEGTDLSALLQKRGPFPPAEACDYIIQACEAIAEAHGHNIVHRDLKPANLFLTRGAGGEPVIKVLDFGVSKVLELGVDGDETSAGGRSAHHDSVVTKATDLLGSPSYMAPEQVISARDADSRSDVWSLGIILFRLISAKAPFTGNSLGDLIQNIMHGPMPNLRDYRPDLPQGLEQVLWRCMERDRARRPDVVELARMLAPFAGPNAAPSLERIAILGPALVTAAPPPPAPSAPSSFTGRRSNWTSPPGMAGSATQNTKKDMSTASFLVWAVLFAVVVGGIAVVGSRVIDLRRFQRDPTTSTQPTQAPTTPAPPPTPATESTDPAPPPPTPGVTTPPTTNTPPSPPPPASTTKPGPSTKPTGGHGGRPPRPPVTPPTKQTPQPTPPPPPPQPTSEIPPTRE
jgi:eukaryotic-like serine/threonine-protein kinase